MKRVKVSLLGCGTVGQGFVTLLLQERSRIANRLGLLIDLDRILVRVPTRIRPGVDRSLITTSAIDVLDSDADIVVELIGGVHSAGAFVRRAIDRGRHVVTANKALLAAIGGDLFQAAAAAGVSIGFEASVCGGIPVITTLQRGLAGDSVESIRGIVNGTCNFILSRMEDGLEFDEALALAQERGFAEAEPSLDVDGEDAAQKLRILAAIAFDAPVIDETVIGIRDVTREDVERARLGGNVIRLVASAAETPLGVVLRVEPRELDANDPLATVRDESNAVVIRGRATGELTLTGKGAGALPTAAAVLSDVIEIARRVQAGAWASPRVPVHTSDYIIAVNGR
ncbi:MAG TPA: homoserine dehydrogenase [Thermoanaerobaculia bacterium]|jgi:homoserine dehydrogenase|nr:homoserine dehydrogenase [Thermoanaerobaculia bacterium]